MDIQVFENTTTVVKKAALKVIEVDTDLYAFSLKTTASRKSTAGTFSTLTPGRSTTDVQGFVDADNLEKLKAGKSYKTRNLMVVPLATQEALRQKGWRLWTDNAYSAWAPNKAFDDVSAAGFDASMVVDLRHDCHMMFDYNGNPLPVGVEFDYISHGMISNGRYDLEKLAAHLLTRSDCKIYKRARYGSEVDTDKYATTVKDAIVDIPYYNVGRGCSRTIYFIWQPNAADYARMWDWCLANNKKYPSTDMHRAVFELDLIGARAAGAALFDEYYKSTEYEEDRNDYDTSDED